MSVSKADPYVPRDKKGRVYQDRRGNVQTVFHRMSARDAFPILREKLLASRPVVAIIDEGQPTERLELGAPTFRNVITEAGEHV